MSSWILHILVGGIFYSKNINKIVYINYQVMISVKKKKKARVENVRKNGEKKPC